MPRIGPRSRPGVLAVIDGRRAEAKLMRDVRAELTKHCGGSPSATQRIIIDQAAMLTLGLHLMDRQVLQNEVMSERNGRQYLAWSNSLIRLPRWSRFPPIRQDYPNAPRWPATPQPRSADIGRNGDQTSSDISRHWRIRLRSIRVSSRTLRLRIPCRRAFPALTALPRSVFGPHDRPHGFQLTMSAACRARRSDVQPLLMAQSQ
jgi:hypothetical protein